MRNLFYLSFILILTAYFNNGNSTTKPNDIKNKKNFYIVEMGKVDSGHVKIAENALTKFYKVKPIYLPPIDVIENAKVKGTKKYKGVVIIETVESLYPDLDGKVLILTNVDICMDRKLNGKVFKNWSVLGLAITTKDFCVVSTKRLKNCGECWIRTNGSVSRPRFSKPLL